MTPRMHDMRSRSTGRAATSLNTTNTNNIRADRTPDQPHREWGGSAAISSSRLRLASTLPSRATPRREKEQVPVQPDHALAHRDVRLGSQFVRSKDGNRQAEQLPAWQNLRLVKKLASLKFLARSDARIILILTACMLLAAVCGLLWSVAMTVIGQLTYGRSGSAAGFWRPVTQHFAGHGNGAMKLPACCIVSNSLDCIPCQALSAKAAAAMCPDGFNLSSQHKRCLLDTSDATVAARADELGREAQYIIRCVLPLVFCLL